MDDALRRALLSRIPELEEVVSPPAVSEMELAQPVDAAIAATRHLLHQRDRARERLTHLERTRGVARAVLAARNQRSLLTPGTVLVLLALAIRDRLADPEASRQWAEAAVAVGSRVLARPYRALLARAWAELGNAERLLEDFGAARISLRRALELLQDEPVRSGFRGDVLSLQASLEAWTHRWKAALDCVEKAFGSYRAARLDTEHLQVQRSHLRVVAGELSEAVEDLVETLEVRLSEGCDPAELVPSCHNALTALVEIAMVSPAEDERDRALGILTTALPHLETLYATIDAPIAGARWLWLLGRVHLAAGSLEEAKDFLRRAFDRFLRLEQPATAAVVSLDLAQALARQGAHQEVALLATTAYRVFDAKKLDPDLWAAFRALQDCEAAETEGIILEGLKRAGAASLRRTPGTQG